MSETPSNAIIVQNVSRRFGAEVRALTDVSFSVPEGQFVSVIGPSGCGKTTVLNMIAGIVPVHEGKISIHGEQPRAGRQDVAYMLARDALLPWRTAIGNAEFAAEVRGVRVPVRRSRAKQILEQVGLAGFENVFPKALSHGMRQRVALARTFCLESPVLLMDEPFGALDAQTKLQLEDVLLSLWMSERRTVVFVTHDLAEAILISDRVIVMTRRPGRIQADIAINLPRPRVVGDLQRDPAYHELYANVWAQLEMGLKPN